MSRFERVMLVLGGMGAAATLAVMAVRQRLVTPSRAPSGMLNVVTDCGAKGDNATDDSAAFQRCLAGATTGAVFIPRGNYLVRNELKDEIDVRDFGAKCDEPASDTILYDAMMAARAAGKHTFKGCFSILNADPLPR